MDIFTAAENGDLETLKRLIGSGGVHRCRNGDSLAHFAARGGNLGVLQYLVEKDSSVLETSGEDHPILWEAVCGGHLDIVKYLVEVHNHDIFKQYYKNSAVDLAVQKGRLNIVRYFIEDRHVDPNTNRPPEAADYESDPLLFSALEWEQHNITTYLIEDRKVDLTALNRKKQNILFSAVREDGLDLIKNVLDTKKAGIDINWRDEKGETLVYLTALEDHIDILRYLVEQKKADVNIPGGKGCRTPVQEAIRWSSVEVFKYLVDHGANLEKSNKYGATLLHLAARFSYPGDVFCEYLLRHGADVKSKNNKGETPLHVAMACKDLNASKCLIDFSGNVNEKNDDGETLLHFVAARGGRKLVIYLVEEKHAQINVAREKDHWTPLHCAAMWGDLKICEYLIKQGADPRAKDKMGRSPAQVASKKALIDYIQKAAEVRSRRSVDHSFWIPAQFSVPNSRSERLAGGQHVEGTIWANGINAFHIHSMLALTNFIIGYYLLPSSFIRTRRIGINDELASNTENLPKRVVHIAEDAVHAFVDFEEEGAAHSGAISPCNMQLGYLNTG